MESITLKSERTESMELENLSEMLLQNLKDAGCSHEMIKQFLCYEEEGQIQEQLDLLSVQRQKLLDKVHKEEKKIVCLDYLVYQIENQKEGLR